MRSIRLVAPLAALALTLWACPETAGQQCPAGTVPAAQLALSFGLQHPTDECLLTRYADGGPADASIGLDDAGVQAATVCTGPDDAGALQLYLAVGGKNTRTSALGPDGGFVFTGHTDPTGGTVCTCPVAIDETFSGNLMTPDGGFSLEADGGLPLVTGVTGSLVDALSSTSSGCTCNIPCRLVYGVSGSPF